jgi:hypothetical protein
MTTTKLFPVAVVPVAVLMMTTKLFPVAVVLVAVVPVRMMTTKSLFLRRNQYQLTE